MFSVHNPSCGPTRAVNAVDCDRLATLLILIHLLFQGSMASECVDIATRRVYWDPHDIRNPEDVWFYCCCFWFANKPAIVCDEGRGQALLEARGQVCRLPDVFRSLHPAFLLLLVFFL